MSIDAINRAIDLFPELTDFGFGTFDERRLSPKERAEKFLKNRELMYTARSIEQFQKACDWLNRQPRARSESTPRRVPAMASSTSLHTPPAM
jgi:hypothetical protein